tara:strand:- start:1444 stop:1629 length:186 start_codon:yes stop_codon:yes gene_type:complete
MTKEQLSLIQDVLEVRKYSLDVDFDFCEEVEEEKELINSTDVQLVKIKKILPIVNLLTKFI